VAPDLGWVGHLLTRLQSLRLKSCGTRSRMGSLLTRKANPQSLRLQSGGTMWHPIRAG